MKKIQIVIHVFNTIFFTKQKISLAVKNILFFTKIIFYGAV